MNPSCKESTSLASELVEEKKWSFDSSYLDKCYWPGKIESSDIETVKKYEQKLFKEALECFLRHNALVDQIKLQTAQ